MHRVLLPSVGVERDRLPRPGLSRAATSTSGVDAREHWETARPTHDIDPCRSPTGSNSARREHARLVGADGAVVRSNYREIRARNESAWLIPNDGTRTNHRLRSDMRRYADGDEVDLVVVGAGAGGSVLTQRLARAGWRVVLPGRRPVLGSGHRLGLRRTRRAHAVLDRAAPDRRRRPGAARLEQLRPRRRRVDGALRRLHPALPPVRLPHLQPPTASARTGRSTTATCKPFYERDRAGAARRRPGLALGRPAPLPAPRRTRSAATARSSCAARRPPASRPGSGRSRSPTAASATGRTASTAASACRAARSTPRPAR